MAGYCAYGSATELVLTYGHGVERFTLDPSIGEFILTAENMTLPAEEKLIYSVNEGNHLTWDPCMQEAVSDFKLKKPKPYTARYVGSMVADVHRTLMYGGIYMYPADAAKVSEWEWGLGVYVCIYHCVCVRGKQANWLCSSSASSSGSSSRCSSGGSASNNNNSSSEVVSMLYVYTVLS